MLQLQIASCQSARGFLNLVSSSKFSKFSKSCVLQNIYVFSVLVGKKDTAMLSSLEGNRRKTVLKWSKQVSLVCYTVKYCSSGSELM